MEDRETARMRKYGEIKTTRIMMATVPHVTSGLGLRKFQADGFLLTRVYICYRLLLLLLITFVLCIYHYVPETDHVSRVYRVSAVLYLQFVLRVILFRMLNMFCTLHQYFPQ